MANPIENKKPSLEVRINSVADAKSVVQNQVAIFKAAKRLELDAIEFVVAKEALPQVNQIVMGVFPGRTLRSIISTRPGNILYELPHFRENKGPAKELIQTEAEKSEQVPIKRKGRPMGSKNKPRPTFD